jgi:RND family efflux transporter MFP subunit
VLDSRDFGRAVAREQAELKRAQARSRFTALDRSRKTRGLGQGIVSQADLEISEQSAALAEIDVSAARVALLSARDRLNDSKIVAPISGTVIRRAIEPGEMVVPGVESTFEKRSLITIADLSALSVKIELNQIDVAQVKVGQRVVVTLDALPGERFEATLREISPASIKPPGKELDVFPVEAVLKKPDPRIKPGMTADVRIQVRQLPSVVSLPIETLRREGGKVFVTRIVDGERGPEKRQVEVVLGARNDRSVEVVSGIEEGARVLIDPPSAADNETKI